MTTTTEEIRARAAVLLSGKPSFVDDDAEFKQSLVADMAVAVDMATHEAQAARNEFFSDTSQLDSSKLAKASDEGRIPNRPLPQIIKCDIASEEYQEFNGDSVVTSDIGTKYLFDGIVIVDGNTVQATLRQEEKKTYSYIPTSEDWQDFIVGGKKTSRFFFYSNGILWEDFEDIGGLTAGGEGYITRYTILDQLYARTGNGFTGKIPDSQIDIVSYDTESQDIQIGAPLYAQGIEVDVEIKVIEIRQSSKPQESALSVDKGLPYHRLSRGGSGYDTDYQNDVMTEFPETLSVRAWGEKRESAAYDRDNINEIFISAWREENQGTFGYEIMEFLKEKKHILQVHFKWVDPLLTPSSITITGKIERTKDLSEDFAVSKAKLKEDIGTHYKLYTERADRKNTIYKSFVNSVIDKTLVFENLLPNKPRNQEPEYELVITGPQFQSSPREIIYIPDENITINIMKVSNV